MREGRREEGDREGEQGAPGGREGRKEGRGEGGERREMKERCGDNRRESIAMGMLNWRARTSVAIQHKSHQ